MRPSAAATGSRAASRRDDGEIVAALPDGEATVGTFPRKEGKVWLFAHNARPDGSHAAILGKVTAVLRRV